MDMSEPQIPDHYSFFKALSKCPNLEDSEAFQYEFRRLASFAKWPAGNEIDFFDAAKKGLFYDGEGKIRCFSCGLNFCTADGEDDPVTIHNIKRPSCPLLQHTDTLNKPLCVSDDEENSLDDNANDNILTIDSDIEFYQVDSLTSLSPPASEDLAEAVEESEFPPPQLCEGDSDKFLHRDFNSLPTQASEQIADVITQSRLHSYDETRVSAAMPAVNEQDMFREDRRLETFRTWPATAKVNSDDLARLGFHYLGIGDRTQCAFCKNILAKWEEGDDITEEHRKFFRACPFVRGVETRNVPIERPRPAAQSAPRENEAPQAACAQSSLARRSDNAITLTRRPLTTGRQASSAMHADYSNYVTRLASFHANNGWQSSTVQPESLAEAGFFFAGFSDNVRCHYCDGGLRNWEQDDDPWIEHARWFPKCGYLLAKKGRVFIESVQGSMPTKKPPQEPAKEKDPLHELPLSIDFRNQARQMGFTDSQIKQAVEKNQETEGHTFLNMQSLVDVLLTLMPEVEHRERAAASAEPTPSRDQEDNEKANPNNLPKPKRNKKKKKKNTNGPDNTPQPAPVQPPTTELIPEDDEESRSLHEENRQLREQRMCKVCMDEEVNIVFLPCGHLVACSNCAPALRNCPICRALIRGSLRTYLS